ncbi:DUF6055 domain-containing protein [Niabella hirudinis]|uniref:DUF6055 domain-containing protein n=1 Tax=Niabella hirudinis TaxID=1285929 RepID=UPI003EBDED4B
MSLIQFANYPVRTRKSVLCFLWILLAVVACNPLWAQAGKKKAYIPDSLSTVPPGNDFANNQSEYSNKRRLESDNFIMFWAKEYGDDPSRNPDSTKRFDARLALNECERFYDYYVNRLKIIQKGTSVTDRYKAILLVTGGNNKTAYGWGKDSVGVLWTPAVRIHSYPYGVLAHELGHAFQYLADCDYGSHFNGPFNEMAAQYMLWQVYPQWMTFEHFHLTAYLKNTYYAFLHPENQYHSPYVLEYWANKRGETFYGQLLHAVKKGEDAVTTYKRITHTSQERFNDEMFDAARRFVTWDLKRVKEVAKPYANMHYTKTDAIGKGWHRIANENCPQNYGYNAIRLQVPASKRKIGLHFRGLSDEAAAGWRYGFVAVNKTGEVVYGKMNRKAKGAGHFKVPDHTAFLWLVVSGAPAAHAAVGRKDEDNPRWPYQFKLDGTDVYRK